MPDIPQNSKAGMQPPPDHPGLGLVRVTETAALAAGRWMGLGDRAAADREAQDAMAEALNLLSMRGKIISGEELRVGEHSPLDSGKDVGRGVGPEMDVEVNAIDGAALAAEGRTGSISAAALAPRGCMWSPGPSIYLDKLVVDRNVAGAIGPEALDAPAGWTLALVARQKGKDIRDLVVFVVARPRHQDLIQEIRRAGARVFLRNGGDISGAMMAADPHFPVDVLMGVGGAAEGLLSACAVKALGGSMLCRIAPQSEGEKEACLAAGMDPARILTCDDMVKGDQIYFTATGVTDSVLLEGAHYHGETAETHSLVLRYETQTRRMIKTEHRLK